VQQQQALQEIVPIGSSRDEAKERLTKAGIEFTTAPGESMYYCSIWQRPDGTRWHLNVAMLFDGENRMYRMREADTVTLSGSGEPTDIWGESVRRRNGGGDDSSQGNEQGRPVTEATDDSIRTAFPGRNSAGR
jgi:hypothetical protein